VTARGASAAEATMVISSYCNRTVEDICAVAPGPRWFQLYVQDDKAVTKAIIQRAETAGCRALCITVDLAISMPRYRTGAPVKPGTPMFPFPLLGGNGGPGGLGLSRRRSGSFNWKDVEWVQSFAKTPVILKGVVNPQDAAIAVKAGVAGIIVSNHGGRALDSVPATIDALPRVADVVAGRFPVLMDGGIRRGVDVLKALGLGATAVLIGRPYLYGLAVHGADGVQHVVNILRRELEFAMALTGRTSLAAVDSTVIWR
jgi:4-hydroxymandelate oxidase